MGKMSRLYDFLIENKQISIVNLFRCHFSMKEIQEFVSSGVLSRDNMFMFDFHDAEGIFSYGKEMTYAKNYYKAKRCFEICLKIDPDHPEANKRLFLDCITLRQFDRALKYLTPLEKAPDLKIRRDYNFYLFLLSFLTRLPAKEAGIVAKMQLDDILLYKNDSSYGDINSQNDIRQKVFEQDFYLAMCNVTESYKDQYLETDKTICLDLIAEARKKKRKMFYELISLLDNEEYHLAAELLKKESASHPLSDSKKMFLLITMAIDYMETTGKAPIPVEAEATDCLGLIYLKQFDKAHRMIVNRPFQKESSIQDRQLALCLKKAAVLQASLLPKRDANLEILTSIQKSIESGLTDSAKGVSHIYLSSIQKDDYCYLIDGLVDLMYDTNGEASIVMETLAELAAGNFYFDACKCIYEIDCLIGMNCFGRARRYINILKGALSNGHVDIPANEIEDMLGNLNTLLQSKSLSVEQSKLFFVEQFPKP